MDNDTVGTDKEVVATVQPLVDPDIEKRSGVKEMAQNADAIAIEKEKEKLVKEKPAARPSFFVSKSARHIIKMDILTSKEDGRVVSVSKYGLGINFKEDFPFMVHTELVFEFSLPNYEDMSTYRQRSASYRREAQQVIVDKIQLRSFLLAWHLKDWNLTDENDKKIVLSFEPTGIMTEESQNLVNAMSPTLLDVVMTVYEKDILLTS